MRRLLLAGLVSAGLTSAAAAQFVQAIVADTHHSGAAAYTGPGDLATFSNWYGLRAFSSADRGSHLINVCNSTGGVDVGCADLSSDASTGALVSATVSGITCPGANCTVKTIYDRKGSLDLTQATVANRPTLPASCATTSKPCMSFVRGSSQFLTMTTSATSLSQPFTQYGVAEQTTGNFGVANPWFGATNNGGSNASFLQYDGSAQNTAICNAGTSLSETAAQSTWHVIQFLANGASSDCTVDGTSHTGNAGSNTVTLRIVIGAQNYVGGSGLTGDVVEAGFGSGTLASMNSNAKTYWGF